MRPLPLLAVFLAWCGSLTAAGAASAPQTVEELQTQIEAVLKRTRTPGVGVALVRRDGPEWVAAVGLADVASGRPATADTLFRIGSTSKAFVSLSILKLQEEGKLSLQDTLKSRAPDLEFTNAWEATDPIRIVHLLEHTTGWDDLALSEYAFDPPEEVTLREGLALRPKTRTSRWKPGTRFSYCNAGPAVAAYIVEKITGQRFEDYVEQNWFRPLGMTTANYFGTPEVQRQLTRLYRPDGKTPYPYWKICVRPSGSINASPRDMANYVEFYLNRGTFRGQPLLPATLLDRMETPASTYAAREGLKTGYGLSNYSSPRDGWVYHGHNGGVMGGLTEMAYLPELGVGYCVMVNSGGRAFPEITRLVRSYLTRDAKPPAKLPAAKVSPELGALYNGWYEPISPRQEMTRFIDRVVRVNRLTLQESGLTWRTGFRFDQKFVATADRQFRRPNDLVPTFALIADRSEGTLIEAGGQMFRRVSFAFVLLQSVAVVIALLLMASSIVFGLVWGTRWMARDLRGVPHLRVRALPFFATVAAGAFVTIEIAAASEAIERLGAVTPWSMSLFALTLAFPVLAAWGLISAWRHRAAGLRRLVWWHSFATALAATGIALYLAYWGVIGLRTWA